MRAAGYTTPGNASVFRWFDLPEPELQPRDILVWVQDVSVNPTDYKAPSSTKPKDATPTVLGFDAAGTVVRVGSAATLFKLGDDVSRSATPRRSASRPASGCSTTSPASAAHPSNS